MIDFAQFPVASKWPPRYPDRLQLYSLPTPNGVKVSIALEELEVPYEAHRVAFDTSEQKTPAFLSLNPNGKIPAIIDPAGPGNTPLALFESGAILLYLASKTGRLMPLDEAGRWQTTQWLMFQMSGIGPMFGQLGYFHKFAGRQVADKRPLDRYAAESRRLLGVLDAHLHEKAWMLGDDYTIADIAIFPWVENLIGFYGAAELVDYMQYQEVNRVLQAFVARPAVRRGMQVPLVSQRAESTDRL